MRVCHTHMSPERWFAVFMAIVCCVLALVFVPLAIAAIAHVIELYVHFVQTQLLGFTVDDIAPDGMPKCPAGVIIIVMTAIFVPCTWAVVVIGAAKIIDKFE